MSKRIYFKAFHMNCVVHQSPGLWVHPNDKMHLYTDLGTWVELAQMLERGKFDALFLADVIGVYDVYRGNREAAVTQAAQIPVNDPMLLIPAMAYATEHLGFAFTSSVQISYDGALALLSGWSGLDFGQFAPDQPLEHIETNAVRTLMRAFTEDPSRKWTMRDLAKFVGIGGGGPVLVGTPEQLADSFQEWVQAGVDGFNLAYALTPGTFADFIEGVVPVLQRRGLMQREYQEGTLREKLFGRGRARLCHPHPAAQYRYEPEKDPE